MKDIYKQVEKNIDNLVDKNVGFSIPVTHEEIEEFKVTHKISPERLFMPPPEWIPDNISGMKILLLAGAGGQQAPLFAALGADVTVIDISDKMLEQDKIVAERENLKINIEKGNICDLSRFSDVFFGLIINPPSLFYVPDIMPIFRECHRALKNGGIFIMSAPNPINYICDYDGEKDIYIARNKLPYISCEHENQGDWIEYGHTLESYIGGQIRCGFSIIGFYEERENEPCDTSFTTMAIKKIKNGVKFYGNTNFNRHVGSGENPCGKHS